MSTTSAPMMTTDRALCVGVGGRGCPCCAPPPAKREVLKRVIKHREREQFRRDYDKGELV